VQRNRDPRLRAAPDTGSCQQAERSDEGAARKCDEMVFVAGGEYRMGSDRHYPEEAPAHRVSVDGFWIDRLPVTDAQFGAFIKAT
jgi:sulfatase modifying factor 1